MSADEMTMTIEAPAAEAVVEAKPARKSRAKAKAKEAPVAEAAAVEAVEACCYNRRVSVT